VEICRNLYQQDAPCAVCEAVGRGSALMIPGTHVCPSGWIQEYQGYLMSQYYDYYRTEFICVDGSPEAVDGGSSGTNGALLYHVRT